MQEREQIINFLLQACDAKSETIRQLQAKIAELEKPLNKTKVTNAS